MNKIVNVEMTGGLIGWFTQAPAQRLGQVISKQNAEGWRVVQIMPSSSGNFLLTLFRLILLLATLLLYTETNGFYIVFERIGSSAAAAVTPPQIAPTCKSCGKEVNPEDRFCQHCGHKQS